jgi:thiol-disulfide isomerase/thioredoxin
MSRLPALGKYGVWGVLVVIFAAGYAANGQTATVGSAYPRLSSGPLERATLVQLPDGVLLRAGQLKITRKNVDSDVARAPESARAELKRNLFFVLESRATQALMSREAAAWAKKNRQTPPGGSDGLLSVYAGSLARGVTVSDQEVRDFYNSNKDMVGGAEFEKVNSEMRNYLLDEKRRKVVEAHVASISRRHKIEVNGAWVSKQYAPAMNNPIDKARASGKPTMVEFGSVGCQYCKMMEPILASLRKDYAGRLKVVYIDVQKEQILAARFNVESIPVQAFFDKNGRESFRHVGFYSREQIDAQLAKLGGN